MKRRTDAHVISGLDGALASLPLSQIAVQFGQDMRFVTNPQSALTDASGVLDVADFSLLSNGDKTVAIHRIDGTGLTDTTGMSQPAPGVLQTIGAFHLDIGSTDTGYKVQPVAFSSDLSRCYVAGRADRGTIYIIDMVTFRMLDTIAVPEGRNVTSDESDGCRGGAARLLQLGLPYRSNRANVPARFGMLYRLGFSSMVTQRQWVSCGARPWRKLRPSAVKQLQA